MFWPFNRKIKPTVVPDIGQLYSLKVGANPFNPTQVQVLAVKEGWVKYGFVFDGTPSTQTSALEIKTFNFLYKQDT